LADFTDRLKPSQWPSHRIARHTVDALHRGHSWTDRDVQILFIAIERTAAPDGSTAAPAAAAWLIEHTDQPPLEPTAHMHIGHTDIRLTRGPLTITIHENGQIRSSDPSLHIEPAPTADLDQVIAHASRYLNPSPPDQDLHGTH
jgi:hypothetical protein